jgi:hypothetical protein
VFCAGPPDFDRSIHKEFTEALAFLRRHLVEAKQLQRLGRTVIDGIRPRKLGSHWTLRWRTESRARLCSTSPSGFSRSSCQPGGWGQ